MAIRGELRPHDREDLGCALARRIEQTVAAGFENPLEPAVTRQEGALAILHRHAQHQNRPGHGTYSFSWPTGTMPTASLRERGLGAGRVFPCERRAGP